ncbi:olfactory receptor 11L1-like [Hyla sarda]|uniref:olfactory receptor 11L1-like n=1 Tax=Hyla sarda TaxID=327740 RepID=UPI0024C2C72D|nr:olfactory receptor 11L1-like [Hyla sarda]
MYQLNTSSITTIHLLGFQSPQIVNNFFFSVLLLIYWMTLCGNLLMIALVTHSRDLHTPMYFFLTQLSIGDLLLTTDIVPVMLHNLLYNSGVISFAGCISQCYVFAFSECSECLILTVMSYDRYVAICNPLHYCTIMNSNFCLLLAMASWSLSFLLSSIVTASISMLDYCHANTIDHFFCDLPPILDLSCSDISGVQLEIVLLTTPVLIVPFIIILMSYSYILSVILKIPSVSGRKKAFLTCSSHLIVVSVFYGTLFGVYVLPNQGKTLKIRKVLSLMYTVVTPLMNPIVYSLRNEHINKAFGTVARRFFQNKDK